MGATTYGRRYLRRLERATSEKLAWAVDQYITTVDHRHFAWEGGDWHPVLARDGHCGLEGRYASCSLLFGQGGYRRDPLRGACHECDVRGGELHRWGCTRLATAMEMLSPDYWPRPVHRPLWLDDQRRNVSVFARSTVLIALALDVPFDAMPPLRADPPPHGPGHWSYWTRAEEP